MHQLLSPSYVAIHFLVSLDPFWFPAVERLVLCAHVPGWVSIHRPVLVEGFRTAGTSVQYLRFSAGMCVTAWKAHVGSCFAPIYREGETPISPYCCWFGCCCWFFPPVPTLYLKKNLLTIFRLILNQWGTATLSTLLRLAEHMGRIFLLIHLEFSHVSSYLLIFPGLLTALLLFTQQGAVGLDARSPPAPSHPYGEWAKWGVTAMGSQIFVEGEWVCFLCMHHLYAHPRRPGTVRNAVFRCWEGKVGSWRLRLAASGVSTVVWYLLHHYHKL